MMGEMAEQKSAKRFTESLPGKLAGGLLGMLWIYAMSGVDEHSFSAFPACVALVTVLLLVMVGILSGCKLVRMPVLAWCSLGAGAYFLIRCLHSYAVVDSWGVAGMILAAFVYYVAGVYIAQNERYKGVCLVLGVALVLSMLALWMVRQPWFALEWLGRATHTPEGSNNLPRALFIYKNFAGFFFVSGGLALGAWALWGSRGTKRMWLLALALGAVCASFCCGTRVPFFIAPLGLLGIWLLNTLLVMGSEQKQSVLNLVMTLVVLGAFGGLLYDVFFGSGVAEFFNNTESHLRYKIWSAICEFLPNAPLWGLGTNAAEWEIIPYYNEWYLPNYAHNDYLQAWTDYGIIGLLLVLSIIVLHVMQGCRTVMSNLVDVQRRRFVAVAVLVLVMIAAYAAADFPWHSFSLVSMTAFACGVMASPIPTRRSGNWDSSSRSSIIPVRAQNGFGKCVLLLLGCGLGGCAAWLGTKLYPVWKAQWEYNALSAPGADEYAVARRSIISDLMPLYPSPALMDVYFTLPQYNVDHAESERLLKMALAANPKQLFTVVILAEVLDSQDRFEEAERLYRRNYAGECMPSTGLGRWPSLYAYHLLRWSRFEMRRNQTAKARSLIEHALAMDAKDYIHFRMPYRGGHRPWLEQGGIKPYARSVIQSCKRDIRLFNLIGIQPDHGWKQPFAPGEKGALYCPWVGNVK